ncbi:MAG: ATPase [Eubacteriales bacterium]|nr:ATPase [Eubacteriales bacterium]
MAGIERHMYPGNNTPEGFFSYYQYILSQEEADRIICIKGGPGVGKSTFMKKIGESMLQKGHNVDFMHCSSDNSSLDGIVLRDKKIAMIDGTAPHVVDPINPGAVDSIIHLGDYWDEEGIRKNRNAVIRNSERVRSIFGRAYNYLAAAGKMYDNLFSIYESAIKNEELYKLAAKIIGDELIHREICLNQGDIKKYFASAITPTGFENFIDTLLSGYKKIYLIKAPIGVSSERMLNLFMEGAVYRSLNVEGYYCPMKPSTKLEHLLIPELRLAFITSNLYHTIDLSENPAEVEVINLDNIIRYDIIKYQEPILEDSRIKMRELLEKSVYCLAQAKKEHDKLEQYYVPNMDFLKIDSLRLELTQKFSQS